MATPRPVIDGELLRPLVLQNVPHAEIARMFKCSERTVRQQIARERARDADWPRSSPARRQHKPPTAPAPPQHRTSVRRLGPDSTADEIEARALEVLDDESIAADPSQARVAVARALFEFADKRRLRRPANADATVDPAEAAAAVMREIERATDNVETQAANSAVG